MSADLVAVFFGLEEGDEVETTPDLLTGEFTIEASALDGLALSCGTRRNGTLAGSDVLHLAHTVEELVVTVGHNEVHADEVVDGAESTGGDIALQNMLVSSRSDPRDSLAILKGGGVHGHRGRGLSVEP